MNVNRFVVYYAIYMIYGMSIVPCTTAQNVYVDCDPSFSPNLDVIDPYDSTLWTFSIRVGVKNNETTELSFVLEHPFWGLIPEISTASQATIVNSTQLIDENHIAIHVSFPSNPVADGDFVFILFQELKQPFLDALQYYNGYRTLEPPIRHSPPCYPIRIQNIQYRLSDRSIREDSDLLSSFLIASFGPRFKIHADLASLSISSDPVLVLVSVNGIPISSRLYSGEADGILSTRIDTNGEGLLQLFFPTVPYNHAYYKPTYGVFELRSGGFAEARSNPVFIGSSSWGLIDLEVPLIPVATVSKWECNK